MSDDSERRQGGTDDHAGDSGDLTLGHALYARHAYFPGISSVGSHLVRRTARFNSASSSLGLRLYRRWTGGSGSGFSWPDMEWLHAYRGDRATAKSSSPQRTPFSGITKFYSILETARAPILRSKEEAPTLIKPAASSTAPSLNQESFAQKGSGVGSDSPRSTGSAPLAGAPDGDLTPQAEHHIPPAHVDQQKSSLVYEAESTPVVGWAQKTKTHNSIERQQGKQRLQADANATSRKHSKGPAYLGRAILQRSIERGRSEPKPNVTEPPSATGKLPTMANLNQQNCQLSNEVERTKVVDAVQTLEKGRSVENQHSDLQLRASANRSATAPSKPPMHLAQAIPQHSTANPYSDTRPDAGAAPIAAGQRGSSGTRAVALTTQTIPTSVAVLRSTIRNSIVQGETTLHRRQAAEGPHSAETMTEHLVRLEPGKSSREPSLDAPQVDENTQAIKAAAQPVGEGQSPENASHLPLSAQSSNRVLPAAELLRKEGIMRSIVQHPAPIMETVHAQAKTVNESENGPGGAHIPMRPTSVPVGPDISSTTQSPGVANASDARRQDMSSPTTSDGSHTALEDLHATRSLNLAPNRPAPVFPSLTLPGSGTPLTPPAQNFGAHLLQRHRQSLITHLIDAGIGHNPAVTVVQPASALTSSDNRVDVATARPGQNDGERGRAPNISNPTHVVSSAPSPPARSQPLAGNDAGDDISVHSGLEAAGPAPENAAQSVSRLDSDSAVPGAQAGVPVVREETEGLADDGAPSRTYRIPENSAGHFSTSSTLAALPRHLETEDGAPVVSSDSGAKSLTPSAGPTGLVLRVHDKEVAGGGLSSNKLDKKNNPTGQMFFAPYAQGRPQAAFHHRDRSAIRGPSTLGQAPRTHLVGDGDTNGSSVIASCSPRELQAVSPSSSVHLAPSLIPSVAGVATSQEHDSFPAGARAGSLFAPVHGAPVLHNLVHRSPVNSVQDRISSFRPLALSPYRSVSLTHRALQVAERLQQSSWSAASGSHFLARQSDGSPAPGAAPGAVPLPSASSSTYQAGKASQSFKDVDVGQLANRVYDLLVRRLASERQRRGL